MLPRSRRPTSADRDLFRDVGGRISELRRTAGLSQETLAWATDISKSYLSEVEAGQKAPSVAVLHALAKELGVPLWLLLGPSPTTPLGQLAAVAVSASEDQLHLALAALTNDAD